MKATGRTIAIALSIVLTIGVFIFDMFTPLGMAVWLLYLLPLIIASRELPRTYIYAFAAILTVLITVGFIYSPLGIQPEIALFNRFLAVGVVWIVSILFLLRKRAEEALRKAHDELEIRVQERTAELAKTNEVLQAKITELKQAEESLLKAKEQTELDRNRLEIILETIPSAVVIIEETGKLSYTNKRAMQLYGFDTVGLDLNTHLKKVNVRTINGEHYPFDQVPVARSLRGEVVRNEELVIQRADGALLPILASSAPVYDADGKVISSIAVFEDISERKRTEEALKKAHDELELRVQERTAELEEANKALQAEVTERKRAEEALRLSEQKFSTIFDKASYPVVLSKLPDAIITEVNQAWIDLFGFTRKEAIGKTSVQLGLNSDVEARRRILTELQERGVSQGVETTNYSKSGRQIIILNNVTVIELSGEKYLLAALEDITERKLAERKLAEQAFMLANISDAVIGFDLDYRITYYSKSAEKMYGYSAEEVMGRPSLEVFQPSYLGITRERALQQLTNTSSLVAEAIHTKKDGSKITVESHAALLYDDHGKPTGIIGVNSDITERKRAEEQIREQAALLDKAQDAIIVRDLENRIIYWNKSAVSIYGWTAEEAIGKNADELLYKEEPPQLIEARKSIIENDEWMGELRQRTKEGKEIIVESHWTLVRDGEEKPKSILVINTDITEKKKLEEQTLRDQRLESIGMLAGGIAHDLNNVLTPITLSIQMLKEELKNGQSQKLLTILEQNSQRAANLIKQVMLFARGVEGERKPLQVKHIITEIEKVAKETFPRNIKIRADIQKDLWMTLGDATQLHQVLMNLCMNARDAMPDGGNLSITASNFYVDEIYARMNIEAKVGQYIVITVSDTGTGIPPEIMDKIFEPFFTTKEHGKGTGLGLSTSLGIVKSHGGFIDVQSEVGKGTAFRVYLSAIKTEIQRTEEHKLELPVGYGELILVAEDEGSVREITSLTLETYGYKVLTAEDGVQAVAEYAQNIDRIRVILMDMMMPVMDGQASIRAIRKINPQVKIIAISGLAEKEKLKKIADHTNAFLPKPYTAEKLLKTIHEVLSAK